MHLLKQPLCCQNAEPRLELNYSKEFKPFPATFLLHQIMRQGRLQACGRIQPANVLHPGVSQSPEANIGIFFRGNQEKIGAINLLIHLGLWINSVYSPYTRRYLGFGMHPV